MTYNNPKVCKAGQIILHFKTAVATQSPYFPKSSSFQAVDLGPNSYQFQVESKSNFGGLQIVSHREKPEVLCPANNKAKCILSIHLLASNTLKRAKQSKSWR